MSTLISFRSVLRRLFNKKSGSKFNFVCPKFEEAFWETFAKSLVQKRFLHIKSGLDNIEYSRSLQHYERPSTHKFWLRINTGSALDFFESLNFQLIRQDKKNLSQPKTFDTESNLQCLDLVQTSLHWFQKSGDKKFKSFLTCIFSSVNTSFKDLIFRYTRMSQSSCIKMREKICVFVLKRC